MLTISVKVTGLDLFPGKSEVREAIKRALRQAGTLIKVRAESNLSGRFVRMRTGKLRRGFKPITVSERGQSFVVVTCSLWERVWFASAVQDALPDLERIFEQELGAAVTKRSVIVA